MNEADVGRVLPASLHQGIADVLPTRLEFYEGWINPQAMRDRRIGPAALNAVLSFLRQEGDAYGLATARAGEYTADWALADMSPFERLWARASPEWLRLRLVSRMMRRLARDTSRRTSAKIRWRRRTGTVEIAGSFFCASLREPVQVPLCGYYAAAIQRLLEYVGLPAHVTMERCCASGAERCLFSITLDVA